MDFLDAEARDAARGGRRDRRAGHAARPLRPRTWSSSGSRPRPSSFTLHARNPAHDLRIGGDWMAFGSVGQRAERRRPGPRPAGRQPRRLPEPHPPVPDAQRRSTSSPGYPVEPIDIHPSVRHLHAIHDLLTLADKPIHAYSLGRQRNIDALEMVRIARGIDDETLDARAVGLHGHQLELAAPARHPDAPGHPRDVARATRSSCMTPFTLAGAMAPVTLAGRARRAERRGARRDRPDPGRPARARPVVYGGFTSNVDMQSGAPAFGTPEYMRTAMVGGQLARRYGVPYRSSNVSRRERARRAGRLRVGLLAVGRDHGRGQPADARRRLDGGRPPRRASRR